ncbi:endonuclease/exonuclease/phosphatase family protein [Minwuia sp.]|uniref:endonuclease/exonuclease/phosphatase family protein n=1 Tax=Minwuia sp. TaxID=2493630 RepID=UPI003A8F54EF
MLRIATWNIGQARLGLAGIKLKDAVAHASARAGPTVEAISARRDRVDVWLLQEAYGWQVRSLLSRLSGYRAIHGPRHLRDTGLAILVRTGWRVGTPRHIAFPALDWVEIAIAMKGCLSVQVETPFGPLRVGNLHTSYDGRGRQSTADRAPPHRRKQIAMALDLMEHEPEMPMLLGGDFNASALHEPETHAVLTGRGWRDLSLTTDRRAADACATWSNANPLVPHSETYPDQDIDLIWARGLPSGCRVGTSTFMTEPVVKTADGRTVPLSDHYGLLVDISAPA